MQLREYLIEYALVVALAGLGAVAAMKGLSNSIKTSFNGVGTSLRREVQVFCVRSAGDCERSIRQPLYREIAIVFPGVDAVTAKCGAVLIGSLTARYPPIRSRGVLHLHATIFGAVVEYK